MQPSTSQIASRILDILDDARMSNDVCIFGSSNCDVVHEGTVGLNGYCGLSALTGDNMNFVTTATIRVQDFKWGPLIDVGVGGEIDSTDNAPSLRQILGAIGG